MLKELGASAKLQEVEARVDEQYRSDRPELKLAIIQVFMLDELLKAIAATRNTPQGTLGLNTATAKQPG